MFEPACGIVELGACEVAATAAAADDVCGGALVVLGGLDSLAELLAEALAAGAVDDEAAPVDGEGCGPGHPTPGTAMSYA